MSLIPSTDADADDLRAVAARLLDDAVYAVERVGGGGNNRIYQVEDLGGRRYALKEYLNDRIDERDRLGAEFGGLRFLWLQGVRDVPRRVAVDRDRSVALYEWVDGRPVSAPGAGDVDAALDFMARLKALAAVPGAERLPLASEACLSVGDCLRQIDRRRRRLSAVDDARVRRFLNDGFDAARAELAPAGADIEAELPAAHRTLSPSDFGLHNALRTADGRLVFLDFEYFGWDDPAKLVSDFLLHPGMALSDGLKRRFHRGAVEIFAGDQDFVRRLRQVYPLFGLRWCLILLNEFLPERWARRAFAGNADRAAALDRQLAKAEAMLALARRQDGGLPNDA